MKSAMCRTYAMLLISILTDCFAPIRGQMTTSSFSTDHSPTRSPKSSIYTWKTSNFNPSPTYLPYKVERSITTSSISGLEVYLPELEPSIFLTSDAVSQHSSDYAASPLLTEDLDSALLTSSASSQVSSQSYDLQTTYLDIPPEYDNMSYKSPHQTLPLVSSTYSFIWVSRSLAVSDAMAIESNIVSFENMPKQTSYSSVSFYSKFLHATSTRTSFGSSARKYATSHSKFLEPISFFASSPPQSSRSVAPPRNEAKSPFVTNVPTVYSEGQYFVAIKSDDCPKLKVNKFDHELSRALSALGVLNVSANIARTKCQTQLNVNITATAPHSAIQLLEDSRRHNLTITVFNRTFKIVDIQRLSFGFDETEGLNSTSTIISTVAKNEFNAYVAVGACFGLVLLVCVTVCCIKCWSKDPNKHLGNLRNSHTPLNPEDYTLTPLPRPTSLYVDYYRNSFSTDVRSTTSAGSVGSTSPTDEKLVQPFDTSIVPLEDSAIATVSDGIRRDSTGSGPTQNAKATTINVITNRPLIYSVADSREKLNPKIKKPFTQPNPYGVSNPTYQRY